MGSRVREPWPTASDGTQVKPGPQTLAPVLLEPEGIVWEITDLPERTDG